MSEEESRLDQAFAALDLLNQDRSVADSLPLAIQALSGFLLTGASPVVREAMDSFGLKYNAIVSGYQLDSPESLPDFSDADATELAGNLQEACELVRDEETDRIMLRLRDHSDVLPEAEIIEARRHHGWFVPILMQECRKEIELLRNCKDGEEPEDDERTSSVPFFSFFLFSEWDIADSVPVILDGLSLPGEAPFELYGDAVHEQVPRYLAQFLPRELDRVDALIRDHGVNHYVRWAAANSYKYLVRDQVLSTSDAVERLDRLFIETKVMGPDGRPGIGHSYELSAGLFEVLDSIGGASRSTILKDESNWRFVDESVVSRNDIEEPFETVEDGELAETLLKLPPTRLKDCLQLLCDWGAFTRDRQFANQPVTANPSVPPKQRISPASLHSVPPPKAKPSLQTDRVPRNAKCPCGSGKKYKQCCLRQDAKA